MGQLSVDAYVSTGTIDAGDDYEAELRNVSGHVDVGGSSVLVAYLGPELVGTVTICPFGSALTEVCTAGEFEFRMLAVAPDHQGNGIAVALVAASAEAGSAAGLTTMVACVAERNDGGRRLYERLGFVRRADRDWRPVETVLLQTYTRSLADVYCPRCGTELREAVHADCQDALELEPPRYCSVCKRRMVVQVVPTGWRASCTRHGSLSDSF